jgi:hypothetical protein
MEPASRNTACSTHIRGASATYTRWGFFVEVSTNGRKCPRMDVDVVTVWSQRFSDRSLAVEHDVLDDFSRANLNPHASELDRRVGLPIVAILSSNCGGARNPVQWDAISTQRIGQGRSCVGLVVRIDPHRRFPHRTTTGVSDCAREHAGLRLCRPSTVEREKAKSRGNVLGGLHDSSHCAHCRPNATGLSACGHRAAERNQGECPPFTRENLTQPVLGNFQNFGK